MRRLFTQAVLIAMAGISSTALALDINISGTVVETPCEVVNSQTINMSDVYVTSLSHQGQTASATDFIIKLRNCPKIISSVNVMFEGASYEGDNTILALTEDLSSAINVGIQLSDFNHSILTLSSFSGEYPIVAGDNDLHFVARYIATAPAASGTANATATFTIKYN